MFGKSRVKKRSPWFVRILALALVITIIASGVGIVFGAGGTFEIVDEDGTEQLYIKGSWVKFGWSKKLTITDGAVTFDDVVYGIISGSGWVECDGTLKLTFKIEMGPFLEPCEPDPPCDPCPSTCPSPCPTTCETEIKAYYCSTVLGTWTVARNEEFTIQPEPCDDKLPSSIYVEACGKKVKIDVSCSLEVGDTFDEFTVVSVQKSTYEDCDDGDSCGYGGCGCNYGDDCGECEEKCNGVTSLTLQYTGECCDDDGSYGCDVPCNPPVEYCEKYKIVTITLHGSHYNTATIKHVVGRIIQPCDKPPTYLYRYMYQSDFDLYGVLDTCQNIISFSGTYYCYQADSWWSSWSNCFFGC
jgi:hypothetical protein